MVIILLITNKCKVENMAYEDTTRSMIEVALDKFCTEYLSYLFIKTSDSRSYKDMKTYYTMSI